MLAGWSVSSFYHISVTVQNRTHILMNFFCLESHILSFPKVLQIPPESLCMLPAVGLGAGGVHPHPSQRQTTYKVLHTTSCILQSNAPEDEHNYCPKHVELTLEVNKLPIVASSLLFSLLYILMMHGQSNTKFDGNDYCSKKYNQRSRERRKERRTVDRGE